MSSGTIYERITQAIFQQIHDQELVQTVDVQHDVTLQGKILRHQIDVYWEFKTGGITFRTIVQAKDWSKPVDQGELLKLWGVIDDIPGQPRAIVVTKTGYQEGAARYAKAKGILLYELFEVSVDSRVSMTDISYAVIRVLGLANPEQAIQGIVADVDVFTPEFENPVLCIDESARDELMSRFGPELQHQLGWNVSPRDFRFYDAAGSEVETLRDVYASIVEDMKMQGLLKLDAKKTLEARYVKIPLPELPFAKVQAITANVQISKTTQRITMPGFVEFALKNLDDGSVKTFFSPRAT